MKSITLLLILIFLSGSVSAQQNVFLDFDSGNDGSINYTTSMRNDIQTLMSDIYQQFDVNFSLSAPTSGPFSTLTFNEGGAGGVASDIDFRNLNKSDTAVINVDGLGFSATSDIVGLSANIGAHEFGHLLGLRHHDSFGPIGSGVLPGSQTGFTPVYNGPQNADEFGDHVMSTPAFGASPARFTDPVWLSERSAIKIAFSETGSVVNELAGSNNTIGTAQNLVLADLSVPNTIITGDNAGEQFDVDAVAVVGEISAGDVDFYSFEASAGELFNFEVITGVTSRIASMDTVVSVLDSNGNLVDYYGAPATNDDGLESGFFVRDSILVDLVLPSDGTYFVQVNGFDGNSAGEYELYFNRFAIAAVPEPGSLGVICVFGLAAFCKRRRS